MAHTIQGKTAAGRNVEVRVDDNGYLQISSAPGTGSAFPVQLAASQGSTTGTITGVGNTVVASNITGVGQATISVYGTYSGINLIIEAYDGVNWSTVPFINAQVVNPSPVVVTGVLTANSLNVYTTSPLPGYTQLRVRSTAYTSGTGNVIIDPSAQFVPIQQSVSQVGTWTMQPGNTANTTPWLVNAIARVLRATLQASAAQTASGNSAALTTSATYRQAIFTLNCTAASGTSPTLNVKIQASDDGGTTWYDLVYSGSTTAITFTQLTTTGSQLISFDGCYGDTLRAVWTITGTTPSFTFAVKGVFVS